MYFRAITTLIVAICMVFISYYGETLLLADEY